MKNSPLFSSNNEQAPCIVQRASLHFPPCTLFPDVTAEHCLRKDFHPPDLQSATETSALFKRPIPFLIHFSGLTSGYPQTPVGNGHSLDRNGEDLNLFLFL